MDRTRSPARSAPPVARRRAGAACAAALAAALLGPAAAPQAGAQAGNCEAIRSGIEARIRASGVERFSVEVVDAAAEVRGGKVVGQCERGTRQIVYRRAEVAAAAPAAPAASAVPAPAARAAPAPPRPAPRPGAGSVITECKDGSTPADGRCKR